MISDVRPPSGTESGEAALRKLLASRAVRGYAFPGPGSLIVFQSSRVARPQDASNAPKLVPVLSSSARSYLDTYEQRIVSEVADVATQSGLAVVTLIQFSSTAGVIAWFLSVTW